MPPPEKLDMQTVDVQRWLPFQFLTSLLLVRRGWFANHARGCVKTPGAKCGNDPICAMGSFAEMNRRIRWSQNEFLHSLARQRTRRERRGLQSTPPVGRVAELGSLGDYAHSLTPKAIAVFTGAHPRIALDTQLLV